jgi:hypothetical protein
MKSTLLLVLTVALSACATKRPPIVKITDIPGRTLPSDGIESVRYAENISPYSLGRYVDPNNGRIMHEAHTIYRVESTAKWNLHPNRPAAVPRVRTQNVANASALGRDELIAELNHQKEVTKAVIQGSKAVTQKLGELTKDLQQTRQVAEENVQLKQQLSATNQRLDLLEEDLRKQQKTQGTSTITNPDDGKSDW